MTITLEWKCRRCGQTFETVEKLTEEFSTAYLLSELFKFKEHECFDQKTTVTIKENSAVGVCATGYKSSRIVPCLDYVKSKWTGIADLIGIKIERTSNEQEKI